jgi:hypothetical protein
MTVPFDRKPFVLGFLLDLKTHVERGEHVVVVNLLVNDFGNQGCGISTTHGLLLLFG